MYKNHHPQVKSRGDMLELVAEAIRDQQTNPTYRAVRDSNGHETYLAMADMAIARMEEKLNIHFDDLMRMFCPADRLVMGADASEVAKLEALRSQVPPDAPQAMKDSWANFVQSRINKAREVE